MAIIIAINKIITADFFPFGEGEGDIVGPRGIDEVTMAVDLSVPIVFNLKEHRALYVRAGFHTGFFVGGGEKKITQGYSYLRSNAHCD